jgi:addiction module HigA family antidote
MDNKEHPGVSISRHQFDGGLTNKEMAMVLKISPSYYCDLVNKRRSISTRIAIKLGKVTDIPAIEWLYQQARYDLIQALAAEPEDGDE